jgi:hypothetical protein
MVIHSWFKRLEKPTEKEGFKEVITLSFVPGPFENDEDEEIFYYHS